MVCQAGRNNEIPVSMCGEMLEISSKQHDCSPWGLISSVQSIPASGLESSNQNLPLIVTNAIRLARIAFPVIYCGIVRCSSPSARPGQTLAAHHRGTAYLQTNGQLVAIGFFQIDLQCAIRGS